MAIVRCPACDHELPAGAGVCPACGRPLNGAASPDGADPTQRTAPPAVLPSGQLSPEFLEWARQHFSEEEFLAGLREVQETGGLELKDFIQELEQEAERRD